MQGQLHYRHWALLKAVPALLNAWKCCRERGEAPEKEQNTADELSDERGIKPWGRGGCKLQKRSARSQPPLNLKTRGEATHKGKMSLQQDSAMCGETQSGKISHFFPLFLEHLPEHEEVHPRAGSSLTFPLTLLQVLTNYTQKKTFVQSLEAAGGCTGNAWHNRPPSGCRDGSKIVRISPLHAMTPRRSALLWAFHTPPAPQKRGCTSLEQWEGRDKGETSFLSSLNACPAQGACAVLPSSPSHKVVSGSGRQQGSKPRQETTGTLQSLQLTWHCTPS